VAVRGQLAEVDVVAVHVGTRGNRRRGSADDLAVLADDITRSEVAQRHLVRRRNGAPDADAVDLLANQKSTTGHGDVVVGLQTDPRQHGVGTHVPEGLRSGVPAGSD
jgi:hypothetical protein